MKRISWFLMAFFIVAPLGLKAQTPEGATQALNYSGLEKKLKASDEDIQDPKKSTKIKTWISRADLMINIFNVHNDLLHKGMDPVSVKLFFKEPKEIQTTEEGADKIETYVYDRVNIIFRNGVVERWVETQKIHPDPLAEATKAIEQANTLNTDGKADKDLTNSIQNLKASLETEAVFNYEKLDYKGAHASFIKLLDLHKYPQMKDVIDTVYFYYGGRAALLDSNYAEANRLFEEAAANKFEDPYLYVFRKQSYFLSGDTAKGVEVIKEGFNKFPQNQSIMIELINYYLVSNQTDEALRLLGVAKANDPKNVSYTFAEATLYDKMNKFEDAERSYKACLEIDPAYFDATYNLGVLYFNKAVKIYEQASKLSDNAEYEKAKKEGDDVLIQAVPYMEKAHEIDSKDKASLETLKTIFYRLKMDDKYNEVVQELKAL
jgi:tetratricopeptide (TPR) repeat protein